MGKKDVTEKHLESFADVFADIVNVTLLWRTGLEVDPDDLADTGARTVYKSAGDIHTQERDVVKLWKRGKVVFCLVGLENQTSVDFTMPLRVFGYEGGDMRYQIVQRDDGLREARRAEDAARVKELQEMKFYPVTTVVLYYGSGHWTGPRTLLECMDVAPELRPYVNDIHINVVEVAYLSDEQRAALTSDFKILADYFYQMRVNKEYNPPTETIRHVEAVLDLMYALTGNRYFEEAQVTAHDRIERGEKTNMRDLWGEAMDRSRNEGITIGEKRGITIGRNEGITIGRNEERKLIMDRLIAGGISPQQAAAFTGLNV